jgi:hypothetical protein
MKSAAKNGQVFVLNPEIKTEHVKKTCTYFPVIRRE